MLGGVARTEGPEAAFHIVRKEGELVPEIEIPRRGVTDVELTEELIHLEQAKKLGLDNFERVQKSTATLNFLEERGEKELARALNQLSITTKDRHEIIDNAIQYAEFERSAKRQLIENKSLQQSNSADWTKIESELRQHEIWHERQIARLNRVKAKLK